MQSLVLTPQKVCPKLAISDLADPMLMIVIRRNQAAEQNRNVAHACSLQTVELATQEGGCWRHDRWYQHQEHSGEDVRYHMT